MSYRPIDAEIKRDEINNTAAALGLREKLSLGTMQAPLMCRPYGHFVYYLTLLYFAPCLSVAIHRAHAAIDILACCIAFSNASVSVVDLHQGLLPRQSASMVTITIRL